MLPVPGQVKDWVLSVRVVLAEGSVVKFGEPLPKNRVGYDFVHLMCGSEGTLGLITEGSWMKITPLPVKNAITRDFSYSSTTGSPRVEQRGSQRKPCSAHPSGIYGQRVDALSERSL